MWSFVLGRRVDYLSPTVYGTDVLVGLLLVCWYLESLLSGVYVRKKRINISPPVIRLWKYLVPLFIFIGINIWFASNRPVAIYHWVKALEYALLGWYIVRTKPTYATITLGLSVGMLYSSGIAIAQFFLQRSVGGILWWVGERSFTPATPGIARLTWCLGVFASGCRETVRVYGTFSHPNVLGGFIAVLLPLQLVYLRLGRYARTYIRDRSVVSVSMLFGVAALVLTFSRSAWIVAGLGVVSVLVLEKMWRDEGLMVQRAFWILMSVLAVGLVCVGLVYHPSLTDPSVTMRADLAAAAIRLWLQSPWFGVGLGNYLVRLPDVSTARSMFFLQPVHNIYLLVFAETGLVGLVAFLLLIGNGIWRGIHSIWNRNKRDVASPTVMYTIPFIGLLMLGLVDHYPLSLQQGQLLFTLFAALQFVLPY
jgi:uncharacterized membrane protein YfbV (UPF0208 family)